MTIKSIIVHIPQIITLTICNFIIGIIKDIFILDFV